MIAIVTIILAAIIWALNIPLLVIQIAAGFLCIFCLASSIAIRSKMKKYLMLDPKSFKKRHGFLEYCINKSHEKDAYKRMLLDGSPLFIYPSASNIIMKAVSVTFFLLVLQTGYELWQNFDWVNLVISAVCGIALMQVVTPFNKDSPARRFKVDIDGLDIKLERDIALKQYNDFFRERDAKANDERWETWEYFLPT